MGEGLGGGPGVGAGVVKEEFRGSEAFFFFFFFFRRGISRGIWGGSFYVACVCFDVLSGLVF